MLRLSRVIKPWKESAALNSHINLYGFWNQTAFLTKSGDLGMVLQVGGVDHESLDHAEQEYAVIHSYDDHVRLLLPNLRSSTLQSLTDPQWSRQCYEIKWN